MPTAPSPRLVSLKRARSVLAHWFGRPLPPMASLSRAERAFARDGIEQSIRADGRARDDYRGIVLELGVLPQASGSARVRLGATDVTCAVSCDIGAPSKANPDHGRLRCSVEVSASAGERQGSASDRETETMGVELGRALERGLLGASASGLGALSAAAAGARRGTARLAEHGADAALDMAQLGIQRGKSCWLLQCDALVSHADGGVLDALGIATRAALAHCRIPKVTVAFGPDPNDPAELELDDDPSAMTALDVSNVPLIVSVTEVGRRVILDASGAEEAVAGATLHVAVDAAGRVRGASMGGRGAVDVARAREMTAVAREAGKRLIAAVDRRVRIAEAEAEARGGGEGGEDEDDEDDVEDMDEGEGGAA